MVDINIGEQDYILGSPRHGLYVPPGNNIIMKFSPGSILLVLASEEYDPNDYVQQPDPK